MSNDIVVRQPSTPVLYVGRDGQASRELPPSTELATRPRGEVVSTRPGGNVAPRHDDIIDAEFVEVPREQFVRGPQSTGTMPPPLPPTAAQVNSSAFHRGTAATGRVINGVLGSAAAMTVTKVLAAAAGVAIGGPAGVGLATGVVTVAALVVGWKAARWAGDKIASVAVNHAIANGKDPDKAAAHAQMATGFAISMASPAGWAYGAAMGLTSAGIDMAGGLINKVRHAFRD